MGLSAPSPSRCPTSPSRGIAESTMPQWPPGRRRGAATTCKSMPAPVHALQLLEPAAVAARCQSSLPWCPLRRTRRGVAIAAGASACTHAAAWHGGHPLPCPTVVATRTKERDTPLTPAPPGPLLHAHCRTSHLLIVPGRRRGAAVAAHRWRRRVVRPLEEE